MTSPGASLGSPTLVLVPTPAERDLLLGLGGFPAGAGLLETCGFGPIAAAARTAERLARLRPRRVLLIGIAGTLDSERRPVGSAIDFGRVRLEGVGAGQGQAHLSAAALGFAQWPGDEMGNETGAPILDVLELAPEREEELLSVCAASASPAEALERHRRYPEASAEDMEAFGVALACQLAGVPLEVVRGISNIAGDRDRAAWQVRAGLAAARDLALSRLLGSA